MPQSVFVEQFREREMPNVFACLDKLLAGREYLEGGRFTVSDVAVGCVWVGGVGLPRPVRAQAPGMGEFSEPDVAPGCVRASGPAPGACQRKAREPGAPRGAAARPPAGRLNPAGRIEPSPPLDRAYLLYIPAFVPQLDLSPYPHVQAYMQR